MAQSIPEKVIFTLTVNYDSNIEKVEYNVVSGAAYSEIANGGSIPITVPAIAYLKITPKTGYSVDSVASANYTMTDNGNNVWIWNYATVAIHESDTVTITSKQGGGGSMSKSVDLITLTGWASLSDGTHTITIKAKADGYRDSEASAGVEVTKGEPASQYTLTNNSEYIGIRVNGQNVTTPYQLRNGDVIYAYATSEDIMSNIKVNDTTYDGSTVNLSNTDITISVGDPAKTGSGAEPDVTINFSVSTGETWGG